MLRFLLLLLQLAGAAIYFYTIYFAFITKGLFISIVTAGFPGLANLYWMYYITINTGDIFNDYNLACMSFVGAYALVLIMAAILMKNDNASEK